MKLCIVKPDGTVAEILLRDRQPSLEAFHKSFWFIVNLITNHLILNNYFLKISNTILFCVK